MKAGTTALYEALAGHPQVFMSPVKEPNFFAFAEEPPRFTAPIDRRPGGVNRASVTDPEAYRVLFDGAAPGQVTGEASHWYLYWPAAPANIAERAPEGVKLIAVLRDPVERAYSEFLHFVRDGEEPITDFRAALDAEPERIERGWAMGRYADRGFYGRQLARYVERFDSAQLRVVLHEDFRETPEAVLRDLFLFLGVDPSFEPKAPERRVNKSGVPRSRVVQQAFRGAQAVAEQVRPLLPEWLLDGAARLKNRNLDKPPMPPGARARLADTYQDDVRRLETLIDRNLSDWL
jgi:hypothetical protein